MIAVIDNHYAVSTQWVVDPEEKLSFARCILRNLLPISPLLTQQHVAVAFVTPSNSKALTARVAPLLRAVYPSCYIKYSFHTNCHRTTLAYCAYRTRTRAGGCCIYECFASSVITKGLILLCSCTP